MMIVTEKIYRLGINAINVTRWCWSKNSLDKIAFELSNVYTIENKLYSVLAQVAQTCLILFKSWKCVSPSPKPQSKIHKDIKQMQDSNTINCSMFFFQPYRTLWAVEIHALPSKSIFFCLFFSFNKKLNAKSHTTNFYLQKIL